jgi:FAD/FMN-containing dehydrogenase
MKRREFVLGSLAAPLLAACDPKTGAESKWSALQTSLKGELVLPDNAAFETARKLYNTRFDHIRPSAVALCQSAQDVRASIDFARASNTPIHMRSGGHSYTGWSTGPGLVIDVSAMNQISVDPATHIATIGAGAKLIDVYDRLAAAGRTLPGGSCPTVGIAGLTLGGGISMLGRAYGMTCDNLREVEIVTAKGEILTCNAESHPDLFWASRGGGGGNFGIATQFKFQTHPLKNITTLLLEWDWQHATRVIQSWQKWGPTAPDALWSYCRMASNKKGANPQIFVLIVFIGSEAELAPLLPALMDPIGAAPNRRVPEHADGLHTMLGLAGCESKTVRECHVEMVSEGGTLGRGTYTARSAFYNKPLSDDAIARFLSHIEGAQKASLQGGVMFDGFGGAAGRPKPDDTAFVHRDALFSAQFLTSWPEKTDEGANLAWIRAFHADLRRDSSGGCYVNYIDPDLKDWQRAYYGSNYDRLVRIKKAYDPDGLFKFPQGITAA